MDPKKKALSLYDEFRNFAFKGNVVDLTVGVVLGAAFTTVIKSGVENLVMPLIGLFTPAQKGYEGWKLEFEHGQKVIPYGRFIGDCVNFLIVALFLYFFIVKFLGLILKWRKEESAPPPLSKDQELLTEIRDVLRKDRTGDVPETRAVPS
jgi:large conductance mechanosensitive channel